MIINITKELIFSVFFALVALGLFALVEVLK